MDSDSEWAYHITFARNLPNIAQEGLNPMFQTGLSGPGYLGHSKGKTFFTEYEDVGFWYSKVEEAAENQSDNVYEDAMVPIVLAFPWPRVFFEDEARGSESAYYTKTSIDPEDIAVWNGSEWVDIEEIESIDLAQAIDFEEEDDQLLAWFKSDNPLEDIDPML